MPELPPTIAYCVAEGLIGSGSEHYRVHRAAHVLGHHLDYLTFVATRFSPANKRDPWLIQIEGQTLCPQVIVLRPSVLTAVRFSDDYADADPGDLWDEMREAVANAQHHGQIVLLDLDDHPYAWNEYHPEDRISPDQWEAHDRYVAQFNAVLCSTQYLIEIMDERFDGRGKNPWQQFQYAPNLYDPWRYDPSKAEFGTTLGTHIFVKARDQGDFTVLGDALRPLFDTDPALSFLHVGEEYAGACCGHPMHHHWNNRMECDDCACEAFTSAGNDTLAQATGLDPRRVLVRPACNPAELPEHLTYNVGVVPLADSVWNYAKTEGKGFEMAAAGIPFVALTGDHPLYRKWPLHEASDVSGLTSEEYAWKIGSTHARKWAETIAQEYQIEHLATWKRLAGMNLSK